MATQEKHGNFSMIHDSKNSIFSVSLLFRSLRNGEFLPENIWEESIIIVWAATPDKARDKASRFARERGTSYKTSEGDEVTWEFYRIERVFQVEDGIENGAEIFSRHLRNSEVESLLTPFEDDVDPM